MLTSLGWVWADALFAFFHYVLPSSSVCFHAPSRWTCLATASSLWDSRTSDIVVGPSFHPWFLQMKLSWWPGPSLFYWGSFAGECEAAWMRISTSESKAMVLGWKRLACPLWVGCKALPQVEGEDLRILLEELEEVSGVCAWRKCGQRDCPWPQCCSTQQARRGVSIHFLCGDQTELHHSPSM